MRLRILLAKVNPEAIAVPTHNAPMLAVAGGSFICARK
jgi:hypothetical protein